MAAARYIAKHLRHARGDEWDVVCRDAAEQIGPATAQLVAANYRSAVTRAGALQQRMAYALYDRRPELVLRLLEVVYSGRASQWLRAEEPRLVISTVHAVSSLCRRLLPSEVPVISVVTDAGRVTRAWFAGDPDQWVFADPGSARHAEASGVPPGRIRTSPIVMAPEDEISWRAPADVRRQLSMPPGFTVLVCSGGVGYGPCALRYVSELIRTPHPPNVVIAPGDNPAFERAMRKAARSRARFVPPSDSLPRWMGACDLIVGKAGWMTLSEASARRRPSLVVDIIPGQEDENARVASTAGTCKVVGVGEAVAMTLRYAGDPAEFVSDFRSAKWVDAHALTRDSAFTEILDQLRKRYEQGVVPHKPDA